MILQAKEDQPISIPQSYLQWLIFAEQFLQNSALKSDPYFDVKADIMALLQFVTGKNRAFIFAFDETWLEPDQIKQLADFLQRRAKGEPIAYILGEKEFWSLPLSVSKETLIPRPDTEILVEQVLQIALQAIEKRGVIRESFSILDLGTGTGAIALALAQELQPVAAQKAIQLKIMGVDKIPQAVELAQYNAKKNQLKVEFLVSHWFENIVGKFNLIVSNPPYIDPLDQHLTLGDVRFEPLSALIATENGYGDLRHIIEQASQFLQPNGALILEHGWQQGEKVRELFKHNGWKKIQTIKDHGGNERVSFAFWL